MERMLKYALFCLLTAGLYNNSYAQEYPRERAYVQTDKEGYLAGELVWFQFYTAGSDGTPLSLSSVAYVELLGMEAPAAQVKIELRDGVGSGSLELPVTLPSGYYQLTGYTRYMNNEGPEVYFRKNIAVFNTFRSGGKVALPDANSGNDAPAAYFGENAPVDDTSHSDPSSAGPSYPQENAPPMVNLAVTTDSPAYGPRSEGYIEIAGLPSEVYSLAVSVAGRELFPGVNTGIAGWAASFSGERSDQPGFSGDFSPEYHGNIITARFTDAETGRVAADPSALAFLAFVGPEVAVYDGTYEGETVEFLVKNMPGKREVATSIFAWDGRKYRSELLSPFSARLPSALPPLVLDSESAGELSARSVALQALNMYKTEELNRWSPGPDYALLKPDRTYNLDEYTRFGQMKDVVVEMIPELRFRADGNTMKLVVLDKNVIDLRSNSSLVLLDGIPIADHSFIYNYDPMNISRIEVYKDKYVIGAQYFDGIASFITYRNDYPGLGIDNNVQVFDYEGPQARRIFYAPDYSSPVQRTSPEPDFRHTLLWSPEMRPRGMSTLIVPFSTSDLPGEYTVKVEGITVGGEPVCGTVSFTVGR